MNIFNELPGISFAEKDSALIEKEIIKYFEELIGRKLYDGDPMRLLLLGFIKYLSLQRSLIDFTGKQNLLKYSTDGYIQNIGALMGVYILEPSKAVTALKFTLSMPLSTNYTIKKGTRATSGDKIYFETVEDAEIAKGETIVCVNAICTTAGTAGNGYYEGQINVLADPFPYNAKVENITTSQGGADRESIESFRERIRLAPESFSTAGPYGAYEFWVKSVNQKIIDVSVSSPNPGEVLIIPLLENGEKPTDTLMEEIFNICNDEKRRPLTDYVIIEAPEEVNFDIKLKFYISRKNMTDSIKIQDLLFKALNNYIDWQKTKLGRDINPSKLTEMLMQTGIKRVEIESPAFTILNHNEIGVADMGSISIEYGGIEDD